MSGSHPARFELERLFVHDLPPAEAERVQAHVSGCQSCRAFFDELESERRAQLVRSPPAAFAHRVAERAVARPRFAWLRRWNPGVLLGAAVAAGVVVLLLPTTTRTPQPPVDEITLRGTAVTVHRSRGSEVSVLTGADGLRPGDRLQVSITSTGAGELDAWFVDAQGELAPLGTGRHRVVRGANTLVGAVEVTPPCVELWLVTSPSSGGDLGPRLERALAAHRPGAPSWLPAGADAVRLRCEP